jgi:hypothetical protein
VGPVYLTTSAIKTVALEDEDGDFAGHDLEAKVASWGPDGRPAPRIEFSWACLVRLRSF